MTLAVADFQAISDSLGLQWSNLKALAGTTPGGNVLTGATNNLARVQALAASVNVRALIADYDDLHNASAAPWSPVPAWFRGALAALNATVATGGILAYLAANPTAIVSQAFADLLAEVGGYTAVPQLQILDAKPRVGAATLNPPSATTLATGTPLGTATTLEVVAGTPIGAAAITALTLTCSGPGLAAPAAPVLSSAATGGMMVNAAYTVETAYVTARGETLPGPSASYTTGGALAPPGAPAPTMAATGGTIAAGTYQVIVSYINANGETVGSLAATVTTTGTTSTITIPSPAASGNATGWYAYMSQAGGAASATTRQQAVGSPTAIGTALTLTAPPTNTGTAPLASGTAPSNTSTLTIASPPASGNATGW